MEIPAALRPSTIMTTPAATATTCCAPASRPATFTNEPVIPMTAPMNPYVVRRPAW